ncbi:MAG TPA: hypothetical protein VF834_00090 [Streptosporangiaceae bacterium]
METARWEDGHRTLTARLAGLAGVAYVALAFAPGSLGGPLFRDISSAQIVNWAARNTSALSVDGYISGLSGSVLALLIILLISVVRGRGLLAVVATSSIAAAMAVDWVRAGAYYALADASQRGHADAAVVALFSLVKTLTYADGLAFGLAVAAVCLLAMRSLTLPRPLSWLGMALSAYFITSTPVQLAVTRGPGGATGPIGVVLGLFWILAVAALLLIKPARGTRSQPQDPARTVAATAG